MKLNGVQVPSAMYFQFVKTTQVLAILMFSILNVKFMFFCVYVILFKTFIEFSFIPYLIPRYYEHHRSISQKLFSILLHNLKPCV